ncbi:hypothetical protein [Pseudopedobacter beijingensis]|uniref:Uncharacterized protein n=1 Tax=Pseudopedobacter beijingensis TaxID=1207056 RepID=A0ABW4IBP2_9SPHI
MKLVFVTNDISYYGASRSLRSLIKGLQEVYGNSIDIYLVIPKRLKSKNDFNAISLWFGVPVPKIHEFCLPFYNNYKGKLESYYHVLFNLKWKINKKKFYGFLKKERFDFIQLNSLTLLDVANSGFPMVLHVRETINELDKSSYIQYKLKELRKIIFIDGTTNSALEKFELPEKCILNNPFSMKELAYVKSSKELIFLQDLCAGKTVFSLIGKIHKDKGTEFFLNAFKQIEEDNKILLIKGGGNANYVKYLKSIAPSNAVFLDAGPNVENLYLISDYIVRGEEFPCIGRTTFEALYAGLGVILPGNENYYLEHLNDYSRFGKSVYTYNPRDTHELISLVQMLKPIDKFDKKLLSNIPEYVKQFFDFIKK